MSAFRDATAALERVAALEGENAELREEIERLRRGTGTDRQLARDLTEANAFIKTLEKNLAKAEDAAKDATRLKTALDRAAREKDERELEMTGLRADKQKVASLEHAVAALEGSNAGLEIKVRELTAEVKSAREERDEARRRLIALTNRIRQEEEDGDGTAAANEKTSWLSKLLGAISDRRD